MEESLCKRKEFEDLFLEIFKNLEKKKGKRLENTNKQYRKKFNHLIWTTEKNKKQNN